MNNKDLAGCALVLIGFTVVAWILTELGTSPHLSIMSAVIFIGVIIYYLFFKQKNDAALLKERFGTFIYLILANQDNYISSEKGDRITFAKKSDPHKSMTVWSYNNGGSLVMRVCVYYDNTTLFNQDFNEGTDEYIIADSVSAVF